MKYRKKPVVVEAMEFGFDPLEEIMEWLRAGGVNFDYKGVGGKIEELQIGTLEGKMRVSYGDYIIKGVKGEFYPCKPDIFEQTYEEVS